MTGFWHNLIRKHRVMSKPGVGDITMCMSRLTSNMDLHISPDDSGAGLLACGANLSDVASLASAVNAADLRSRVSHMQSCDMCLTS